MVVRVNARSNSIWRLSLQTSVVKRLIFSLSSMDARNRSLVVLLKHDFLLKLAFDSLDLNHQYLCVYHVRLLSHLDEVGQALELDLRN